MGSHQDRSRGGAFDLLPSQLANLRWMRCLDHLEQHAARPQIDRIYSARQ